MKQEIIKFLETDRSFNGAIALYSKYGRNANYLRLVNLRGDTKNNKAGLLYQLAKLAGLSGRELNKILNSEISKPKSATDLDQELENLKKQAYFNKAKELVLRIDLSTLDPASKAVLVTDLGLSLENMVIDEALEAFKAENTPADLTDENEILTEENENLTEENEDLKDEIQSLLDKAPEQFAKTVKLRQEFPFLNETSCPDELKILVADMLTAHHAYVEAHPKLALAENAEKVNALAETVVENYLENRSIWEELNHYKEEGKILGEHPKLKELAFQKEIAGLKTPELIKLKDSLYNKITRTKKQIAENAKPHLKEDREARVSEFEIQFAYVKKVLEIEG